jgi:hypothetical protein
MIDGPCPNAQTPDPPLKAGPTSLTADGAIFSRPTLELIGKKPEGQHDRSQLQRATAQAL